LAGHDERFKRGPLRGRAGPFQLDFLFHRRNIGLAPGAPWEQG